MHKEKLNNRKLKAIETKNKIYRSANQLFREYGFEKVSVDSIVELAGVSKGTFYVHFDSKDALIAALINDFVKEIDLDYKTFLETLPTDTEASDVIISLIGKISDILNNTIGCDSMQAVYKAQITKAINTEAVMGYNRELYKMFNDIITRGVQRGEFRQDLSVDLLTKHVLMAIRGITYEWCIRYPDFNLKDEAERHFKILLSGMKR